MMLPMPKLMAMILVAGIVLAVAACGSGISQEEHDAVLVERDGLDQQVSDLQGQLTTITTERDGLDQQVSDLHGQLTATTTERDGLNSQLTTTIAERDGLNQQASNLQGQLTAINTERDGLKSQLTTATTERDGLNQQISDLQGQLTATNTERNGLQSQLTTITTNLDTLNQEVEEADKYWAVSKAYLTRVFADESESFGALLLLTGLVAESEDQQLEDDWQIFLNAPEGSALGFAAIEAFVDLLVQRLEETAPTTD